MRWNNRIAAASAGLMLFAGAAGAHVLASAWKIENADSLNPYFIRGRTVEIRVLGSPSELAHSSIKLNGKALQVTFKQSDSGSMTASITGLYPGENTLQLLTSGAKVSVAELKVTRAIEPKIACGALAGRMIAASEIGLATKGAKIDSASLEPATPASVPPADSLPRGLLYPWIDFAG